MSHNEIVGLVIAYTLVGGLVCTVAMTLASLGGWFTFVDQRQQQALFKAIILELAVIGVSWFAQFLNFSPSDVKAKVGEEAAKADLQDLPTASDAVVAKATVPEGTQQKVAVIRSPSFDVEPNGGTRSFVLQCPPGYQPLGIDPRPSFPARIDVKRDAGAWTVTFLNLHGKGRPVRKANVSLICAADSVTASTGDTQPGHRSQRTALGGAGSRRPNNGVDFGNMQEA